MRWKGTKPHRGRTMRVPRGALAWCRWPVACACLGFAFLTGCAGPAGQAKPAPLTAVGTGEGMLNLLGVTGYIEDGTTDPRVDWATAFEQRTGCRVSYTEVPSAGSIPEVIRRHGAPAYDGVLAPPSVASQLIGAGLVAPLNLQIVGGYTGITRVLRDQAAATSGGRTYGVPYTWDSYVLGYATSAVQPAPRTWGALFDPAAARYGGKIILPDTPFTIALAALYLESARPALGITDPYELTASQFAAATSLLNGERRDVARYYAQDPQVIDGLADGGAVLGAVLPRHVDVLARAGRKVAAADPAQGTTGLVNYWLMSAQARDPNCMYEWLTWSLTPRVQQQVAEWTGSAPVNPAACDDLGREVCDLYHVADPAYLSKVAFAHVPQANCRRGKQACASWAAWQRAWASITGVPNG